MRLRAWSCGLLLVATLGPQSARAQTEASRLIQQAREEIDALNVDSAFAILERALRRAPTAAERVRAFALLGITQLSRDDRVGARSAFEQALRLDATLRVDSLAELHTDVRAVFGEVRIALGITDARRDASVASSGLSVAVEIPVDTTVPAIGGLLRVTTQPNFDARVLLSVRAVDTPGPLLWADTSESSGAATSTWNLRGPDGEIVAPGRYVLRVSASDSVGRSSPAVDRLLVVDRSPVDTLDSPAPLGPMAPESVHLIRGSPLSLAAGLVVALSAVALPSVLGNAELQSGASYPSSIAVGAVVGAASVVGFVRGSRVRQLPGNVLLNSQTREQDAAERRRIELENVRRREAAPIRVQVEGGDR